ncbi:hypothetical protein, partial [Pseudarthrobacter oxydans]|uniref:hypothetical protein n=1 Tax=Pseudarthrobacter oxydans TaxID=1671 RepID=UPI0034194B40
QLQIGYSLEKCRQDGGMTLIPGIHFPTNREEPVSAAKSMQKRRNSTRRKAFAQDAPRSGISGNSAC